MQLSRLAKTPVAFRSPLPGATETARLGAEAARVELSAPVETYIDITTDSPGPAIPSGSRKGATRPENRLRKSFARRKALAHVVAGVCTPQTRSSAGRYGSIICHAALHMKVLISQRVGPEKAADKRGVFRL